MNIKKDLSTEPVRGFLDLSDQPLPPDLEDGDLGDMDYEPSEPREEEPMELPTASLPDGLQEPLGYPLQRKDIAPKHHKKIFIEIHLRFDARNFTRTGSR